jgi:adenosine/AMP kinase
MQIELEIVKIENPENLNVIIGQAHFIKTVEDIYEALMGTMPGIKFAVAFSEASTKCLIRAQANDLHLKALAEQNLLKLACGHVFIIFLENAFPVNVLNQIKNVPEVCRIFCATANPLEVVVVKTAQGRGVMGVIDGFVPKGIETEVDVKERKELLRKFGYKL